MDKVKKYRTTRERRRTLRRVSALQEKRRQLRRCLDCGRALPAGAAGFTRCAACRTRRATAARDRRRLSQETTT